jgi:hypothetical protein
MIPATEAYETPKYERQPKLLLVLLPLQHTYPKTRATFADMSAFGLEDDLSPQRRVELQEPIINQLAKLNDQDNGF